MASLAAACRLSARLAAGQSRSNVSTRGLRSTPASRAAQNFTMPAMSPTMTEGNIASWKVKEGDSFSTGDVLLEIETDKAQMDVEAQDDGVMAKITQPDGSKAVKVGSRIAILAEMDDDLSTIELPAEEAKPAPPQEETSSGVDRSSSSESQAEVPPTSKDSNGPSSPRPSGKATKQTYPLYPSVQFLLREHSLESSEADKIPASGPNGRLLKGDVLAYLGSIPVSYPSELSTRVAKLSHLDLSNIKVSTLKKPEAPPAAAPQQAAPSQPAPATEVAVPISLTAVLTVQKRIQDTLGVTLPLATFIARATDVANDDLPRPANAAATPDELFEQVLGLNRILSRSLDRGHYTPQITALPASRLPPPTRAEADVYNVLTGRANARARPTPPRSAPAQAPPLTTNLFSVSVPSSEEARARRFLERVKVVLETEPGRLVL
ncbi:MAG: pyridoxine biosynthesis protein [Thelocarpon impressellum]|nr:MAG: pyridoxine biosynthesis protein [Thelocarpon impressellum]